MSKYFKFTSKARKIKCNIDFKIYLLIPFPIYSRNPKLILRSLKKKNQMAGKTNNGATIMAEMASITPDIAPIKVTNPPNSIPNISLMRDCM